MFDDNLLEKTSKDLLKTLTARLIFLCAAILIAHWLNLGIVGSILFYTIPIMAYQVWLDKRIVIPKLITIFFWIALLVITSSFAGYLGVLGIALFYLLYFLYKLYRAKDTRGWRLGVDLIKNRKRYAEEMVARHRRAPCPVDPNCECEGHIHRINKVEEAKKDEQKIA